MGEGSREGRTQVGGSPGRRRQEEGSLDSHHREYRQEDDPLVILEQVQQADLEELKHLDSQQEGSFQEGLRTGSLVEDATFNRGARTRSAFLAR